jgi:hypothetical protein
LGDHLQALALDVHELLIEARYAQCRNSYRQMLRAVSSCISTRK